MSTSASGSTRVPLSILDRANNRYEVNNPDRLVPEAEVLSDVVARAQHAEQLGYHRFWVAEHHSVPGIAGSTPTLLATAIAANTSTIRVGTGGIMVPSHQPLVIAEQIATLQALFPGRFDAGLGSSVGFTPAVRRALHQDDSARYHVPDQIREIISYLNGEYSETVKVTSYPQDQSRTPLFVLASHRSIGLAAEVGAGVVIGGPGITAELAAAHSTDTQNQGDSQGSSHRQKIQDYRATFQPDPAREQKPYVIVSLNVSVADTSEQAHDQLLPEAWALMRSRSIGSFDPLRPLPWIRDQKPTDTEQGRLDAQLRQGIAGTADEVVAALDEAVELTGADELLITGGMVDPEAQRASDRTLIEAWVSPSRATAS